MIQKNDVGVALTAISRPHIESMDDDVDDDDDDDGLGAAGYGRADGERRGHRRRG